MLLPKSTPCPKRCSHFASSKAGEPQQKGSVPMASKRCLPTRFFKDPDVMNVGKDTQLILVGLVLLADDEGRELAHPKLLSREIDYPPEQIESSLRELADNDLLLLYQVGRHRYYSLT